MARRSVKDSSLRHPHRADPTIHTHPMGIRELQWVDPASLEDNPDNWKRHPARQLQALDANIRNHGWAGALLYNERTKRLLDGHGRKAQAIKSGITSVPVLIGSWDESSERAILASLDTVGAMYETDAPALASLNQQLQADEGLISRLSAEDAAAVRAFGLDISAYVEDISDGELPVSPISRRKKHRDRRRRKDQSEAEHPTIIVNQDVFYPSSNRWGFPDLRDPGEHPQSYLQPDQIPQQTFDRSFDSLNNAFYCHSARPFPAARVGGVLGFFCDDWRFELVYEDAARYATDYLLPEKWTGILEPDFSTYWDWPFAMRTWSVYRSRWCLRCWQELGLAVVPIVRRSNAAKKEGSWLYKTLPANIPVMAIQCRMVPRGNLEFWQAFQSSLEQCYQYTQPKVMLVYGGLELQRYVRGFIPKGPTEYFFLDSFMTTRRKRIEMGT